MSSQKILVADDEVVVLQSIEKGLTKYGYSVEVATDGIEAAMKLQEGNFDVVLSDLKMPKCDGLELLQKSRDINKNAAFIMITGYGTVDNALEAMKLGAFDYVSKPFTIQEIKAVVEKAINAKTKNLVPEVLEHKKIEAQNIQALVGHLMEQGKVIAPIAKGTTNVFTEIENPQNVVADYVSTTLPPKKFLLPIEEELFKFDREKGSVSLPLENLEPKILFGIHPDDMQGIIRLDKAFREGYPEANYLNRRKNFAIVGISPKSDDKSFYQDLGLYDSKEGFDIFLTKVFSSYIVDVLTERGQKLLKGFKNIEEANESDVTQADIVNIRNAKPSFDLGCHPSAIPDLLRISSEDKIWNELADKCLACGSCSLVCPTCYCFDVTDKLDLNLKDGARYRKWDSCQTEGFAKVGTGENFREHRQEKLMHRFSHKFSFFNDKFGTLMCVGCGRCGRVCLAGINPVEVIRRLAKENNVKLMKKVFSFEN